MMVMVSECFDIERRERESKSVFADLEVQLEDPVS